MARPGGMVCIAAQKPTIGALPGSFIGGPDCAPNQASAALRCSDSNQLSSNAFPDIRNSWDRPMPAVPPPPGIRPVSPQKARPRAIGEGEEVNADIIASDLGPHTATKRR